MRSASRGFWTKSPRCRPRGRICRRLHTMFDYFVYTYGPTLVLSILCAVFGALGHAAKQLWRSYVNTKEKESVAYTVAAFVE